MFRVNSLVSVALALVFLLGLPACQAPGGGLQVGTVYSFDHGDGRYGAVKVLALPEDLPEEFQKEDLLLARMYLTIYDRRPTEDDLETSGGIAGGISPDSMGSEILERLAIPLKRSDLERQDLEVVADQGLTKAEREGIEMWKEMGKVPGMLDNPFR